MRRIKDRRALYDAIVVFGVTGNKKYLRDRTRVAVKLYLAGKARIIIFSGRWWGGLKQAPKQTEARSMAFYAHQLGVCSKDTILEEGALNTSANFYLTKVNILKPNKFRKIIVITQASNLVKCKFLARKILGQQYQVRFVTRGVAEPCGLKHHLTCVDVKQVFGHIKDGDDKKLGPLILGYWHYQRFPLKAKP